MYFLRKEYFTRYGRAQEAFRTRAKPRGRPVKSDKPPQRSLKILNRLSSIIGDFTSPPRWH
jgi:hypothetical protein